MAYVAQSALDYADELVADAAHDGSMGTTVRQELAVCEHALAVARKVQVASERVQKAVGITMAMDQLCWWRLRGDGRRAHANANALGQLWVELWVHGLA